MEEGQVAEPGFATLRLMSISLRVADEHYYGGRVVADAFSPQKKSRR